MDMVVLVLAINESVGTQKYSGQTKTLGYFIGESAEHSSHLGKFDGPKVIWHHRAKLKLVLSGQDASGRQAMFYEGVHACHI